MTATASSRGRRLLREPLLHFLAFGAIVFAVDHAIASKQDDPSVIKLSAAVDAELKTVFRSARGQDPGADELKALRQRWLDNEVLYREGLALRLDQGDSAIRDRVIFKALNVVQANLSLPTVDEATLRAWFERHRANYDQPPRIDFLEAVLEGKPAPEAVAAFAQALNAGTAPEVKSGLRIFKGRPQATVADSFGAEFAAALAELPAGEWRALPSKDGVRAVRVEGRTEARPAEFEAVHRQVLQDWKDRTMQELRTEGVRELAKKYTVVMAEDVR